MEKIRRTGSRFLGLWLGASLVAVSGAGAELTSALQVRSLSFDAAKAGEIAQLTGTVTFIEGPGAVFLQDETAATFFRPERLEKIRPGDIVEVVGPTQAGNYLPGIGLASYRILGHGPLPKAVKVGHDDLISGRYHYQRVAIEGVARSVTPIGESHSVLRVDVGSRIVEAWVDAGIEDENAIVDSRVRVEGLAAGGINRRRQLVQPYLRTRDSSEIIVLEPAPAEALVPRVAAAYLATFRVTGQGNHRIRVEGVVTAAISKLRVFVRSGQTAFALEFYAPVSLEVGDRIEAVGFTEMGRFSASVVDAKLLHRLPGPSPVPLEIDIPTIVTGARDADLVSVTATLTDFFRSENGVVLSLQRDNAALQARGPAVTGDVPLGSLVQITGICQVESSTSVVLTSRPEIVTLQFRSPQDVRILKSPSWWTTRRLGAVLIVLAGVTLLAGLWIAALRRQVRRQTRSLRQRVQSEAALEERHRIAREFHDSLAQDLTGLALRIDAAALCAQGGKGRSILEASRGLLARIQAETHNIVFDLRSSPKNDTDLASALESIAPGLDGTEAVEVRVEFAGPPPSLPPATIHHLRMIARESVTNAIKHARASRITIDVAADGGQLRLRITDDGEGFDPLMNTRGKSGHFGCVGIRERARKLGGQVNWRSEPRHGTTVEVLLPLASDLKPGQPPAARPLARV